ncbi:MAG: mandelate racemase/muconate lactonizing enzyme family protein, partial [Anaerolineales bacterium]
LLEHRIQDIQSFEVKTRYPRVVGRNARLGVHGRGPSTSVGMIRTDRGATGWGVATIDDAEAQQLIGRRVGDLFDPDVGVIDAQAMPLDFALHDLAGVILDQPVYEMLGARGGRAVPCYDGAIYMDDTLPKENPRGIEAVLENCRADHGLGYRAFKLKIGRGYRWMEGDEGLARDIAVTRRVREDFPDCDILVDANDGYTCEQFLVYLEAVADCDLYWIEEPFPENRKDLLCLREALVQHSPETLIVDGERDPDLCLLLELVQEGLLDVLNMDIQGLGFTTWRRWMPRLVEAGAYASPHTWGNPLKTQYAAQFACGLGGVPTVEGVPGEVKGVDWSGYRLCEGLLRIPMAPGFGMKLLEGALQ